MQCVVCCCCCMHPFCMHCNNSCIPWIPAQLLHWLHGIVKRAGVARVDGRVFLQYWTQRFLEGFCFGSCLLLSLLCRLCCEGGTALLWRGFWYSVECLLRHTMMVVHTGLPMSSYPGRDLWNAIQ